jgi:hypothetical protein
MFSIFKRRTAREKLLDKYNDLKAKAFKVSKTNRKESDRLEFEANEILKQIDTLDTTA